MPGPDKSSTPPEGRSRSQARISEAARRGSAPDDRSAQPAPIGSGVLVIDKKLGLSSMSVVNVVRRRAGRAKTGHAGTLDPLATGVLVLAIGKATKAIPQLMETEKQYETTIDLSGRSPSHDLESEIEPVAVDSPPARADIEAALEPFRGPFLQRPPRFSAIQVGGRRAYKDARAGRDVELEPRPVLMHELRILSYDWPLVTLRLRCGKGLYVRSLARDLGRALETGGYCATIRRTAVGPFTLEMATPLDDVPDPLESRHLIPLDDALRMVQASAASADSD